MRRTILLALLGALALAGGAKAGGFATVQLSSLPEAKTWAVDLTVLQHGRTPLDGLSPAVVIRQAGQTRTFAAHTAGRPGVYHARVVFPSGGTWTFEIEDGFGQVHHYAPVEIDPAPGTGSFAVWPIVGGILGAAALGALVLAVRRARAVPATT